MDCHVFAPLPAPAASQATPSVTPAPVGSKVPSSPRKVKVADQLHDTELELMDSAALDEAFLHFKQGMGADPLKEAVPTPEQLTVLHNKVVIQGCASYADFSVLMPFGRLMAKQMKSKGFFLQEDGTWRQQEVLGPPTFEAWEACWAIYKTMVLTLQYPPSAACGSKSDVMTWAALEEYHFRIQRLFKTYPECWHLIMAAEDLCRGEHLERCRRQLARAPIEGTLPMNLHLNIQCPLIEGFGDQQTLDANLIVARMVVLCLTIHLAGGTFSVENPWDSFW